ncbi:MAG: ISNCY family transposase [Candidatus Orphnella occulta]|nr:ISNCY family transposase [Candidatus Orphnella occulta]
MTGKDIIIMSMKELKRIPVISSVINKQITQKEAAGILGISRRQIIRIVIKVKQHGDISLIHKTRGKPSNRRKPVKIKSKALSLCNTIYKGFSPTFASEKLFEKDNIQVNPETLRLWFKEAGIYYKKRKSKKHRSWRPRKTHYGEMIQMDGSHHPWLEQRGPKCVLMGYIDDATGRIYGRFYEYEGTMPAMDSFKRYIKRYGIPQSIYLDKHSTYKSTKNPTLEDELNNIKNLSQFERALKELGVDVIHANSPQAKGRIERSFKTHQDRLVKDLRLANISTIEEANSLLGSYIGKHNARFSVKAKNKADLHRLVPGNLDLESAFSIKNKAALRNDFTVQYKNRFYQILDTIRAKEITIEERLNGKLYICYKDTKLKYRLTEKKPNKPKQLYKIRKPRYIPPQDSIYRRFKIKCA